MIAAGVDGYRPNSLALLERYLKNVPVDTLAMLRSCASTQGNILEEAKAKLIEAVQLVLQANRELAGEPFVAGNREPKGFSGSETPRDLQF